MGAPPPIGLDDLGDLQEGRGRPLRLRRQLSVANFFLKGTGRTGPGLA